MPTITHIKTPLTQEEINLILDYIEALDHLTPVFETVKGWCGTTEDVKYRRALRAIWDYTEKTGRALNEKVDQYAGNVWN